VPSTTCALPPPSSHSSDFNVRLADAKRPLVPAPCRQRTAPST
jgi:hypothetical protein